MPDTPLVIWFLERPGERLQCEIRPSDEGGYELIWSGSDGRAHVERSDDPEVLVTKRLALENWLRKDGWVNLQ